MSQQQNIVAVDFGYAVWIPESTPNGQKVTIQTREHAGIHIMHAESPDQSELYFEVAAYPTILDHEALAQQQQDFLRQHSDDGTLTAIAPGTVSHLAGTTFDFRGTLQGRWKERRFLFIDGPARTYRIVHDPTSALNVQSLSTLELRQGKQRN